MRTFHLGTFEVKGQKLLDECVGRIGNIFVPADRYLHLERFLNRLFPKISEEIDKGNIPCSQDITRMIGEQIETDELTSENFKSSFLFWAYKNEVPVFCPGIND